MMIWPKWIDIIVRTKRLIQHPYGVIRAWIGLPGNHTSINEKLHITVEETERILALTKTQSKSQPNYSCLGYVFLLVVTKYVVPKVREAYRFLEVSVYAQLALREGGVAEGPSFLAATSNKRKLGKKGKSPPLFLLYIVCLLPAPEWVQHSHCQSQSQTMNQSQIQPPPWLEKALGRHLNKRQHIASLLNDMSWNFVTRKSSKYKWEDECNFEGNGKGIAWTKTQSKPQPNYSKLFPVYMKKEGNRLEICKQLHLKRKISQPNVHIYLRI